MSARQPMVVGEPAADRLWRSLDYRLHPDAAPLTRTQVAVVLHALADHTSLMAALDYERNETCPWPEALSLGRWLHHTADQMEES